jgi:hypothetical protein
MRNISHKIDINTRGKILYKLFDYVVGYAWDRTSRTNSPINRQLFTQTSLPVCLAIGSELKKKQIE